MENETKKIKLDIGSGRAHFEDYITLDKDRSVEADWEVDFEELNYSQEKGFYCIGENSMNFLSNFREHPLDEIRAHHILEHFKTENKVKVMALCWDLLKEGGILNIEVPLFPHSASIQDPTHLSFWNKESFKYFTKDDPFGEAFAKRYSQYPVPLFEMVEEWWCVSGVGKVFSYPVGEETNKVWAYGIKLKKVTK